MNYYISDLHIGHGNALIFDSRPFKTLEEQDEAILKNINDTVTPQDNLYILGDLSWYNPALTLKFLKQIRCKNMFLLVGNHDRWAKNGACKKQFQGIYDLKTVKDEDKTVVLCHYPLAVWDKKHRDSYHLYGHVHNNLNNDNETITHTILNHKEMEKAYNIGCMMPYMNYTPRTLEQIIQLTKK